MSCTCQITNANVETIFKVRRAPNTSPMWVGYKLSRNFVNVKFAPLDTTPIKPERLQRSLSTFLSKRIFPGLVRQERFYNCVIWVTDQLQINIIFFHEIKLVQAPISCLNKTNRSSKIPSQIVSFVIKMFLGKEYLMR